MPGSPTSKADGPKLRGYEILRVLGRGRAGVIYLVLDQASGALRAVKRFDAPRGRSQSFFGELASLFAIDHPNVVRCRDLVYGSDAHYLILDYAEGGDLWHWLGEHGSPSAPWATEVLRQVARGLEAVHEAGFVHRDVKPANILISETAEGPLFKLSDLAMACRADAPTQGGRSAGTPAYMAPEQFYDRASPRSDLYSLGVIFYEMLTGARPFKGTPAQVFAAHQSQPPALARIEDPGCRDVVGRLLAKDPADRPASAHELIAMLAAIDGEAAAADGAAAAQPKRSAPAAPRAGPAQPRAHAAEGGPAVLLDRRSPEAEAVYLMPREGGPDLWIVGHEATDAFRPDSGRYAIHAVGERIACAAAPPPADAERVVATGHRVAAAQAATDALRPLFPLDGRATALAHDPGRGEVVVAGDRFVSRRAETGRERWTAPMPNYFLPARLAPLGDGDTLVSTGPTDPKVHRIGADGRERGAVGLPGPAVALASEAGGPAEEANVWTVIAIRFGQEGPATLRRHRDDAVEEELELPADVVDAALRPFGAVLQRGSRLEMIDRRGEGLGAVELGERIVHFDASPDGTRMAALTQRTNGRRIRLFATGDAAASGG